jgi:hypothetical protein
MQTHYEKVFNRMRRSVLLVAVAIIALLSASGVAMALTSTEGSDESHEVKVARSEESFKATAGGSTAFRSVVINIPSGTGVKEVEKAVTFSSNVTSAVVVINGFKLDYASDDHEINVIEADVDLDQIVGPTVHIDADTQYADKNFDDSYSGYVTATVIATVQ